MYTNNHQGMYKCFLSMTGVKWMLIEPNFLFGWLIGCVLRPIDSEAIKKRHPIHCPLRRT